MTVSVTARESQIDAAVMLAARWSHNPVLKPRRYLRVMEKRMQFLERDHIAKEFVTAVRIMFKNKDIKT